MSRIRLQCPDSDALDHSGVADNFLRQEPDEDEEDDEGDGKKDGEDDSEDDGYSE